MKYLEDQLKKMDKKLEEEEKKEKDIMMSTRVSRMPYNDSKEDGSLSASKERELLQK